MIDTIILDGSAAPCPIRAIGPLKGLLAAIGLFISFFAVALPAQAQTFKLPVLAIETQADIFDAAPVPETTLAATTGREQANWLNATSTNTAVVADNTVGDNSVTGAVNISDAAFQNGSGISMINFNTGNNSSINAAMSVNLQINYANPGQ